MRYCPLSRVGALWSICSVRLQNSYGSVTDMGLPFFIFQMEGFVEAVLYVFLIIGVYGWVMGWAVFCFRSQVIRSKGVSFGPDGEVCTSPRDPRLKTLDSTIG